MKRYTRKNNNTNELILEMNSSEPWTVSSPNCHNSVKIEGEAINKFAEYEDLQERLEKIYGECDVLLETIVSTLEEHASNIQLDKKPIKTQLLTDEDVDRWEQFKELGSQVLTFPVKVGDTIKRHKGTEEFKVTCIIIEEDDIYIRCKSKTESRAIILDNFLRNYMVVKDKE